MSCVMLAVHASGQSSAAVEWKDSDDATGYCLYVDGSPAFTLVKTNQFQLSRLTLPFGVYSLTLTALSDYGESYPAGPLIWTNGTPVTICIQTGTNLMDWVDFGTNLHTIITDSPRFYRLNIR